MLDICCPGLYPGVLLWPICHPTSLNNLKAWPRSVWSWRMGLMARLSQLFSQIRFGPPLLWKHGFCLPPWSSSIRWAIPCSHVRVFARRLGRWVRFLLIAVTSGVLRTWIVPGPLCPGPWSDKAARPKPALWPTTQNEPCDETRTFPMLRFPPVRSRVGLGEHPSDCLRGSKRAHKAHNKNKTNRDFIRDHLSCRS